jgi:D-amino-acid dehydrogenase
MEKFDTIVLGAGVVGINTAYWLFRRGQKVAVIDRQAGPGLETSFANGGQISVSHAEPWANPSAPIKVIKWLMRADAPLLYRPKLDPYQWFWLLHWLVECLPYRTTRNIIKIVRLASFSRDQLIAVRNRENLEYDQQRLGILHFYRDSREFENAIPIAQLMRRVGCDRQVVDRERILQLEPALEYSAKDIVGGTYTDKDESGDAYKYTAELAKVCQKSGVEFYYRTSVLSVETSKVSRRVPGIRVKNILRDRFQTLKADNYVVALGAYSAPLLRKIGIYLDIYPAKGYSITIPTNGTIGAPSVSLTDDQYKLVYSRLGERLRVAGTAELNGYNTKINMIRCRAILEKVRKIFPEGGDYSRVKFWTGLRPATPSNVPYIGRSKFNNLWLNTGHGTLGWTMGCGSGKILADKITSLNPSNDFHF